MVLVVDSDFDDEDSVDVGGEGLEVELCDIFYFEDDVGGEVIALGSIVVYFSIGHVDVLSEFFVLGRVDCLSWFGDPLAFEARLVPREGRHI